MAILENIVLVSHNGFQCYLGRRYNMGTPLAAETRSGVIQVFLSITH